MEAVMTTDPGSDAPEKYRAPALEKGLDILEMLARHAEPMTAAQIAAALHRSPSELFRMIQVLERKGFIEPSEDGDGFTLTDKLFALGLERAPTKDLIEGALPHMRKLARTIRQSCHIAVRSGDKIVVVTRVENPGYFGYSVRTGHRRHMLEATSGVVLYAFQPQYIQDEWAERIFAGKPKSLVSTFLEKVERARTAGVYEAVSDLAPGVIDLSAPVMGRKAASAALTVPYIAKADAMAMDDTREAVRDAAARISDDLKGVL
jgi:DNA-binding IclR family transcriptional regulator